MCRRNCARAVAPLLHGGAAASTRSSLLRFDVRILLVRHGESLGNVDPMVHAVTADHAVPLSPRAWIKARGRSPDRGFYQANSAASVRTYRLWVSPYQRKRPDRRCSDGTACNLGSRIASTHPAVRAAVRAVRRLSERTLDAFPNARLLPDCSAGSAAKSWARMPQGREPGSMSRRRIPSSVQASFSSRCARARIREISVICHGVTLRAFVMMWCTSRRWFEAEKNRTTARSGLVDGR